MHNAREHIREREGEENGTEQVAGLWPPPGNAQDSAADGHKVSGDIIRDEPNHKGKRSTRSQCGGKHCFQSAVRTLGLYCTLTFSV